MQRSGQRFAIAVGCGQPYPLGGLNLGNLSGQTPSPSRARTARDWSSRHRVVAAKTAAGSQKAVYSADSTSPASMSRLVD